MGLLPTDDGEGGFGVVDELQRTEEGHVEFTRLGEKGAVMPRVAGLVAIAERRRGRTTRVLASAYLHPPLGEQIFAGSDVDVPRERRTLRTIKDGRPGPQFR